MGGAVPLLRSAQPLPYHPAPFGGRVRIGSGWDYRVRWDRICGSTGPGDEEVEMESWRGVVVVVRLVAWGGWRRAYASGISSPRYVGWVVPHVDVWSVV